MHNRQWLEILKKGDCTVDDIYNALISKGDNFSYLAEAIVELAKREGISNKDAVIFICIFCDIFGGTQLYFPKLDVCRLTLENFLIYKEFQGSNIKELSDKYKKSDTHIYRIIEQHRKIDRESRERTNPYLEALAK
ncbi:TPA: Mor transcription activator family protein [Photobacterium damselae]